MAKLTPNEERVLSLRASGLTLREIAEAMGWGGSKERVRQIEARARRKKGEERRKKNATILCSMWGQAPQV